MKSLLFILLLATLPGLVQAQLGIVESRDAITISNGDKTVLVYHKAIVDPPVGVSPLYKRSGFIHPLCAPNGGVVTGAHPKDHAHHFGLWHAWVKTKHKGRAIDFWNLKKQEGTVRYARTEKIRARKDLVGFTVVQEHIVMPDEVILEEHFSIDTHQLESGEIVVDHSTAQKNVTKDPLELPAYRYGGPLAYRAPHHWDKDNSSLLTSASKSRKDGHATRANWCRFSGPTDQGPATITILCHPENHDAPQRQRIWPETSHNGAIFYNWVPAQEHDFEIKPGTVSTMRYRIVLSNEPPAKATIDGWFEALGKKK